MGFFDKWKKQRSVQVINSINNGSFHSRNSTSYENAIRMITSSDYETQKEGRRMMLDLGSYTSDGRVFMWLAQEYERNEVFSKAAEWYLRAQHAQIADAKLGYMRCNNPYHIDRYFSITLDRGCGTPYYEYEKRAEEKQRRDYLEAINQLKKEPTADIAKQCLQNIHLIASANRCIVPEAQVWMGDFFEIVQEDFEKAAGWYKLASDNNSADGARSYADMLISGKGVEKNIDEAFRYYRLAADRGQPEAQFVIAQRHYNNGRIEKALKYYRLSAKGGYAPAEEQIKKIESASINNAEMATNILTDSFLKITTDNELDNDGMLEFYAAIYQPNDFCEKVYEYCTQHYATQGAEKVAFEYCMTAFYGAICLTALWNRNMETYESSGTSAWDIMFRQINVEYTDSNAEEFLGTKQGDEKAESIYALIGKYIDIALAQMSNNKMDRAICLHAIRHSYQLGMLVAKKEFHIENENCIRERIKFQHQSSENDAESIKSVQCFYTYCVKVFHDEAMKSDLANHGLIFIPELMKVGEKAITVYLQDVFFMKEFGKEPERYYYEIMSLALQTGICFGEKWHKDFAGLTNGYVNQIMLTGPSDDANIILSNMLGLSPAEEQKAFYQKIYTKWIECHKPYWKLEDPKQYTFKALVAAYQLGVSMILEKYGF